MKTLEFKCMDFEKLGIKEYGEKDGYKVIGIGDYRYLCHVKKTVFGEVYQVKMAYKEGEQE